jgi:(S)-citramalyl-CoA lyase
LNKFPVSPIFVPANKLDWIKKIEATLADCIILDLEDSVPLDQKDSSRISLYNYLEETKPSISVFVRINPLDTDEGVEDLALFSKNADLYDALVLPKIENQKTLDGIPNIPLVLLIETPLAVKNLVVLAKNKQVVGVALGGADLSASLGSDMSWDSLLFHRSAVVLECAINNLFSLDSPFMDIGAPEALAAECALSSKMGFNGKAAIHPSQIDIIQGSFLPTEEEINEAKEILAAFYASPDAAVAVQGKMVDLPVVKSMEKRLLLAGFDPEELKNKGA